MSKSQLTSKLLSAPVFCLVAALGIASGANAATIISVDLDPLTPDIQRSRIISQSEGTLNIDIVLSNDGSHGQSVHFSIFQLEALFNNGATPVLGGVSNVTIGDVVLRPSDQTGFDLNALRIVGLGDTLTTAGTAAPVDGFANGTGPVSVANVGSFFSVDPHASSVLFNFDVTLADLGTTDLRLRGPNGGEPIVSGGVTTRSVGKFSTLESATLTVVPEPSSLLATGLMTILGGIGRLWFFRRRRQLMLD